MSFCYRTDVDSPLSLRIICAAQKGLDSSSKGKQNEKQPIDTPEQLI